MRAYNQLFFTFCLSLTTGILWVYMFFSSYFNSGWEYRREAHMLESELEESRFEASLLRHQMNDLKQTVATALPLQKVASDEPFNDLLKTLRAPASVPTLDMSSVMLERGKKLFSTAKYDLAIKEFEKLKNLYPASAYQVQARFFLAESLFLQREYKKCTEVIENMVLQFPDHQLTGFILLRLGQISEHNNQVEVAQEIYRTVFSHFEFKPLKQQAQILIKNLEIE